jgi:hypothetical protein
LLLEDEVISFLPNIPSRADKNFHETGFEEKSFCLEVAVRDTPGAIPMDANLVPTISSERAFEKKMVPCLQCLSIT